MNILIIVLPTFVYLIIPSQNSSEPLQVRTVFVILLKKLNSSVEDYSILKQYCFNSMLRDYGSSSSEGVGPSAMCI